MAWRVDGGHTSAMWAADHLELAAVRGLLGKAAGTVSFDEAAGVPTAIELEFDAQTLNSGSAPRDEQLRGEHYLDVEHFPLICFSGRAQGPAGPGGRCQVRGELSIHGVSRPLELDVEVRGPVRDHRGRRVIGLRAETVFDRGDFGMTGRMATEAGVLVTGEVVRVAVDLEAVEEA